MMRPAYLTSAMLPAIVGLAVCFAALGTAAAERADDNAVHEVVAPPACSNNKGEAVRFVETDRGRPGVSAGMARRDENGAPVVMRSNYSATPPEFQGFIDRHECAHHQTGDVDRPHPPRNGPEHLMNESVSDCIAILRLRDEDGYDKKKVGLVVAALRSQMAKVGFPEISIASRISNIENCFLKLGAPQDFVNKVLARRGLLQP